VKVGLNHPEEITVIREVKGSSLIENHRSSHGMKMHVGLFLNVNNC